MFHPPSTNIFLATRDKLQEQQRQTSTVVAPATTVVTVPMKMGVEMGTMMGCGLDWRVGVDAKLLVLQARRIFHFYCFFSQFLRPPDFLLFHRSSIS
jgi:hypothetical protein